VADTTTRIFVPQPIPQPAAARLRALGTLTMFEELERELTRDELRESVRGQHVLFGLGGVVYDEEIIDAAAGLRLIAAMHPAPTYIDIPAATRRGVLVTGIPNTGLAKTTAEFTFALLMATAWRIPEADQFLRAGHWQQNQSDAFLGTRLYGKTLGIVGMGAIGTDVAHKARCCGMHVRYTKRTQLSPAEEVALGVEHRPLDDLFRESDFIVLTPALTPSTRGLVTAELIGMMKPTAILINTSRGLVVDEEALEDALVHGRIRGAGLDVFHTEQGRQRGPGARMRELENVVLTPHMGSAARETRVEMAMRTVENIARFVRGERPLDLFNPELYGPEHPWGDRTGQEQEHR
jgi:glyoxylate reductase